jgi:aspartate/methionine/tyrosine aminotransferase
MSDMLLAKPKLPPDWVDVSVGEPHLVRDNLIEIFEIDGEFKKINATTADMVYPYPTGYQPLVRHLEEKHKAPVIITNGAKQALGAVFYALKKMGWDYCGEKSPYWALIPPLAKMHGIDMVHANGPRVEDKSPFLLLSPNNPDGHCESPEELLCLSKEFKDNNLPLIHDGAYYTHIYLPGTHTLPAIGDVQIFSMSKMLGLSGLRLGYAVCYNPEFYKLIQEYVEAMTVGVSIYSQVFLYDLLDKRMRSYPTLVQRFEGISSMALEANKKLCLGIDPEILEVPSDVANIPGMFGWFKAGPKADFTKSKINIIDGALFGAPGMVRMNLAFSKEKMEDIVLRLNSVK